MVKENMERIAHLVTVAAAHVPNARQIVCGGSLLTQNEAFRNTLKTLLPQRLQVEPVAYPPIWGACLQSAKLAGLPAPDPNIFMDSYRED
jgi:hypothetical protein